MLGLPPTARSCWCHDFTASSASSLQDLFRKIPKRKAFTALRGPRHMIYWFFCCLWYLYIFERVCLERPDPAWSCWNLFHGFVRSSTFFGASKNPLCRSRSSLTTATPPGRCRCLPWTAWHRRRSFLTTATQHWRGWRSGSLTTATWQWWSRRSSLLTTATWQWWSWRSSLLTTATWQWWCRRSLPKTAWDRRSCIISRSCGDLDTQRRRALRWCWSFHVFQFHRCIVSCRLFRRPLMTTLVLVARCPLQSLQAKTRTAFDATVCELPGIDSASSPISSESTPDSSMLPTANDTAAIWGAVPYPPPSLSSLCWGLMPRSRVKDMKDCPRSGLVDPSATRSTPRRWINFHTPPGAVPSKASLT